MTENSWIEPGKELLKGFQARIRARSFTALDEALFRAEQRPTESLRARARATTLSDWIGFGITIAESKFLLAQDDLTKFLSDRRAARYAIKFNADANCYQWSVDSASTDVLDRARQLLTHSRLRQSLQTACAAVLMVGGATAFGILIAEALGLEIAYLWHGALSPLLRAAGAAGGTELAVISGGFLYAGFELSSQVVGYHAGERLIEASAAARAREQLLALRE